MFDEKVYDEGFRSGDLMVEKRDKERGLTVIVAVGLIVAAVVVFAIMFGFERTILDAVDSALVGRAF